MQQLIVSHLGATWEFRNPNGDMQRILANLKCIQLNQLLAPRPHPAPQHPLAPQAPHQALGTKAPAAGMSPFEVSAKVCHRAALFHEVKDHHLDVEKTRG